MAGCCDDDGPGLSADQIPSFPWRLSGDPPPCRWYVLTNQGGLFESRDPAASFDSLKPYLCLYGNAKVTMEKSVPGVCKSPPLKLRLPLMLTSMQLTMPSLLGHKAPHVGEVGVVLASVRSPRKLW